MLSIIKKFFSFSGERKHYLWKGIIWGIVNSISLSFQFLAVFVVLRDISQNNVSSKTALLSLGLMALNIIGCMIGKSISMINEVKGSFYLCADKRSEIADRMKYMPMGYFNGHSLGQITSTVTSTMEDMQDLAPRVLDQVIHSLIQSTIIMLIMLIFDWRIGLVVVIGTLVFAGINHLLQRKAKRISPKRVTAQINIVSAILEYVQGMSVVRSFNLAKNANITLQQSINECEKQNITLEFKFIPLMSLQTFILKLDSVIIILTSIFLYLKGTMDISIALMMIIFSFVIFAKLDISGKMSAMLRLVDDSIDRITEIFDSPTIDENGKDITAESYDIVGKNVSFSYQDKKTIDNVSFNIPQGTTTAIIGPSGGGKTTLCNLIARFWDVTDGSITLGGKNIKEYKLDNLLANFSMVFQNVYLFNDTIENNIKFGNPSCSKQDVIDAAKKASCHEFISSLPDGYDTVIGEGGASISGGEKQRISIARAILKNAPIIILDEATANVDPENENKLKQAIEELTKDKTIIMIAHRLKTVQNANQILVIEDGKLIQQGTHDNLINEDGLYSKFINMRKKTVGWKLG